MFGLGTTELILILAIILLVFGVGKLPQIGESMGNKKREKVPCRQSPPFMAE